MTSSVINVKVLVAQMRTVIAAISEYDRQIEALCLTHDDYHLFAALRVVSPYFFLLWLFCRGKQAVR